MGKLPDTGENHRSCVRQDVTRCCRSNQFVKERRVENREKENRSRNGNLFSLCLVKLNLQRTTIGVTALVARGGFLCVVGAGEER